ncbi:MAG TPA: histidinol dehydrogenase, partial [Terriglobales bacterium]|nr:histidinol dehydrogenase [Terriglobales bacterium]
MKLITAKRSTAVLAKLANRGALDLARVEKPTAKIVSDVRKRGDSALLRYARKFDGFEGKNLRVGQHEIDATWQQITPDFRHALETAAANIRRF